MTVGGGQLAAQARCTRRDPDAYRECLRRFGFAIMEPVSGDQLSLEQIMAPLGEPVPYQFGTRLTMQERAGTENSQFRTGAIPMHADAILNATDVSFIGMECLEAPIRGGETLIARSEAFFDVAPAALVDELRSIEIEYWSNVSGFYVADGAGNPVECPIRVDPVTGADTLYVGVSYPEDPDRNFGAAVVGYTAAESTALFARMADLLNRPEVVYRHRWQVGQVLVLDNRRVLHARAAYSEQEPRKLERISVA
ncbi:TauD/TfdA dioxygenase family protein [Nocardia nova]|uniref:TauD/TfdA dioxygenase family protein n=1 Tax=Nocardia nova TaxID=37330 RepID=UPI0009ED3543|nr:TauD/TfdA family dioxygenase [Nocardia nova]